MKIKHNANITVENYPFHKMLVDELVPLLENYEDKQNRTSNVKATMTDWYITTPQIERLRKFILNEITSKIDASIKMIGDIKPFIPRFRDIWANVYRKGDYAVSHRHQPAVYSFVYFLKSRWFYSPLVFDDYGQKIRPRNGRYIIFPSYLRHSVPKHRYDDSRMTLSGNVYYDQVCREDWLSHFEDGMVSLI